MSLSGADTGELKDDKTLAEQGIAPESVLALDVTGVSEYSVKVISEEGHFIELPFIFNQTILQLKQTISTHIALPLNSIKSVWKIGNV